MKLDRPLIIGLLVFVIGAGAIVYMKVEEAKEVVPEGMIMVDGVLMPAAHEGMSAEDHAKMIEDMDSNEGMAEDMDGMMEEMGLTEESTQDMEEVMDDMMGDVDKGPEAETSAATEGEVGTEVNMGMPVPGGEPVDEMQVEMMDGSSMQM